MNDLGRTLFITKLLRLPLAALQSRLQDVLHGNPSRDTLRYFLHSAHDFQISQFLLWLSPVNLLSNLVDIPYASVLNIELHYDNDCIKRTPTAPECFTVEVMFNNVPLQLDTCLQ